MRTRSVIAPPGPNKPRPSAAHNPQPPPPPLTNSLAVVALIRPLLFLPLLLSLSPSPPFARAALVETERVAEYHKRNHTWPPRYHPNTPGWIELMSRRLDQVARVEDKTERYNGYVQTMSMVLGKNFTENGWGLARAPEALVEELRNSLHEGLKKGAKLEFDINVIEGENRPLFITQNALNAKVLNELRPLHEEWSGVELKGAIAYGLRVYRNQSTLNMHVDKANTHIISSILHVDHDKDGEPWPIVIEDFQGNTNEVVLESGDMLFYESSKCLHGRPRTFNGEWYSSIFTHYYPVGWDNTKQDLESHYAVPPHWSQNVAPREGLEKIVVVGTSMKEPECKDGWCYLDKSVKWYGPAIPGKVITTGFQYPSDEKEDKGSDGKPADQSGAGKSDPEL